MQPSSETPQQAVQPELIGMISLKELAVLLVRHNGIHQGLYDVSVEFQIGVGSVGPSPSDVLPGAMIGVNRIGLAKAPQEGPNTIDAAKENPPATSKKPSKAK